MAKKKQSAEAKKSTEIPAWMPSFTDMVTLLFCFFVLLFAMAEIDPVRMRAIADHFSPPRVDMADQLIGSDSLLDMLGNGIIVMPDVNERFQQRMVELIEIEARFNTMAIDFETYFGDMVFVDPSEQVIIITLTEADERGSIRFTTGSSELNQEALSVLDFIAGYITEFPASKIVVEGHTDSVRMNSGRFPDDGRGSGNLFLSHARAYAVADYLSRQSGIGLQQFDIISRGESSPIGDNATVEGQAMNRRVEIWIYLDYFARNGEE